MKTIETYAKTNTPENTVMFAVLLYSFCVYRKNTITHQTLLSHVPNMKYRAGGGFVMVVMGGDNGDVCDGDD